MGLSSEGTTRQSTARLMDCWRLEYIRLPVCMVGEQVARNHARKTRKTRGVPFSSCRTRTVLFFTTKHTASNTLPAGMLPGNSTGALPSRGGKPADDRPVRRRPVGQRRTDRRDRKPAGSTDCCSTCTDRLRPHRGNQRQRLLPHWRH